MMDNAIYVLVCAAVAGVGVLQPIAMAYLMSDKAGIACQSGRYSSLCAA